MEETELVGLARQALWLIMELSMPIMLVGLFVGLIVALFQALTQIQEMTLAFVPKILAIFIAMYFMLPLFAVKMRDYMEFLADVIVSGQIGQ